MTQDREVWTACLPFSMALLEALGLKDAHVCEINLQIKSGCIVEAHVVHEVRVPGPDEQEKLLKVMRQYRLVPFDPAQHTPRAVPL